MSSAKPSAPVVLLDISERGVATVTLNRPEVNNAYNGAVLQAIIDGLEQLAKDPKVRALVIRGAGRHFQAGADINWLAETAELPPEQNFAGSMLTTRAMQRLNEFPLPTIAQIHGACFGGGIGIACCCDVVVCEEGSLFGITEVRVGAAPTPISTHMVHAMGLRHARRYALTGERFDAKEAHRIGLVHEVVARDKLEARVAEIVDAIFLGSPTAIRMSKASMLAANGWTLEQATMDWLAHESWMQRASKEGKEGFAAFLQKRKPAWYKPA